METVGSMNEQATKTVIARISGKVQGVWFRAWTQTQAESRGLSGWVRNEPDSSVSAVFIGPAGSVDAMIEDLWQGSPASKVHAVETEPYESDDLPSGFEIRR
jgi:acylphosphatase